MSNHFSQTQSADSPGVLKKLMSCNVLKHISAFIKSSPQTVWGSSFSSTLQLMFKLSTAWFIRYFWSFACSLNLYSHKLHRLHQDHSSKGTKRQCNDFWVYTRHYFILMRIFFRWDRASWEQTTPDLSILQSILKSACCGFVPIFALKYLFNQSLPFTSRLWTAIFVSIFPLM